MIKSVDGGHLSLIFYSLMNSDSKDIQDTVDISHNRDENVRGIRVQFDSERKGYSIQTYNIRTADGGDWIEQAFINGYL